MGFAWLNRGCLTGLFKLGIIFLLVFLLVSPASGQDSFRLKFFPHRLDEIQNFSFLPQGLTKEMISNVPSDDRVKNHLVTILFLDDKYYAFRECFFDVYTWNGDAWENLYPGKVHGYNCFSWQFTYEGDIYSMGRYGFYKMHSELIKWSPRDRRWNIVPVQDLPPNYSSPLLALKGDSIISLFGVYLNESASLLEPEPDGYLLDLKEMRWLPMNIISKVLKEGPGDYSNSFDLDDYLVFKHNKDAISGFFILDKNDFNVYFWSRPNTMGGSPFFLFYGNKLVYQEFSSGLVSFDFQEGRAEFEKVGEVRVKRSYYSAAFPFFAFLGLIILAGLFAWLRLKKTSIEKNIRGKVMNDLDINSIERVMDELLRYSGQTLQVEELDRVFEIDHLPNPDYKRVRRSRLIAEINSRFALLHGKELIKRQRNKADKRLVEYLICAFPEGKETG